VGVNGNSLKAIFLQQSSHWWWAYKREARKVTPVFSKPGKVILCSSNKVGEPWNPVGKWNELFEHLLLSDRKDTSWEYWSLMMGTNFSCFHTWVSFSPFSFLISQCGWPEVS
jgi:hypothetical protein